MLCGAALAQAVAAQEAPAPIGSVGESDVAAALPDSAYVHKLGSVVLTAAELENRYLTDPVEIAREVPNMVGSVQPALGSGNLYALRGLSGAGAVGTYIDGVLLPSELANHFGMFDMERVEIVRGPAPLLHAQPSAAGGMHVALHRPGTDPYGVFEGFYGAFDRLALRGSVDIPGNEAFALNVSGYYQNTEGYVLNLTTGETLNDEDRSGVRLGIRLSPHPRLDWHFAVAALHDESLNLLNFDCDERCDDRFATTGLTERISDPLAPFGGLPITGEKARRGLANEADTILVTSAFSYTGDRHQLTLTTGAVGLDQDFTVDLADGRDAAIAGTAFPPERGFVLGGETILAAKDTDTFSQDVRLEGRIAGGLGYTIGGALRNERRNDETARILTVSDPLASAGALTSLASDRRARIDRDTRSLYAALAWENAALRIEGGTRYTDEDVSIDLRDLEAGCSADCFRLAEGAPGRIETEIWQPFAEIRAGFADGLGGFARAARGYRPAGWIVSRDSDVVQAFRTERNWTYEAGFDAALWDDRLRFGVTGFYLSAEDVQTASPFAAAAERIPAGTDFESKGFELAFDTVPFTGFSLHATAGWQNAEYTGSAAPLTPAGDVAEPVFAPDVTAAATASYDWYIATAESYVTPSLGVSYRGAMETGIANSSLSDPNGAFLSGSRADSRVLVNAGLALRTDDDWWLVSVECDNCLDKTYVDSSVGLTSYLAKPMTWTFRARRKF